MQNDLNDSLADLLGGEIGSVRSEPVRAPANYEPKSFDEVCGKCRGSGQTPWGMCFRCKGAGKKSFRTSAKSRAASRASAANSKAKKEQNSVDEFAAREPAVYAWLVESAPRFEFARSVLAKLRQYGDLTEGQLNSCKGAIVKRDAARAERAARDAALPAVDTAGVDRLKDAFDRAIEYTAAKGRGRSLKSLRITIGDMVISPAKATSTNPGALYVKSCGQYIGKVKDGRFFAGGECSQTQETRVLAFIADPKAAAKAYGIETGMCCICNATLTNKESIEAGIGPICAMKMGW